MQGCGLNGSKAAGRRSRGPKSKSSQKVVEGKGTGSVHDITEMLCSHEHFYLSRMGLVGAHSVPLHFSLAPLISAKNRLGFDRIKV